MCVTETIKSLSGEGPKISSSDLRRRELDLREDRIAQLRCQWQALALSCQPSHQVLQDPEAATDLCQRWWDRLHALYEETPVYPSQGSKDESSAVAPTAAAEKKEGSPQLDSHHHDHHHTPFRKYHNLIHVCDMMDEAARYTRPSRKEKKKKSRRRAQQDVSLASAVTETDNQGWLKQPKLVELAIFFHDVVYNSTVTSEFLSCPDDFLLLFPFFSLRCNCH